MGTINPRARGDASLGGKLRAGQDDRQQIRRLLATTPKQNPPAVATIGGYAMNEVSAVSGSFRLLAGEQISSGTTWGSVYDPHAGTAGGGSIFVQPTDDVLIVPPGWYQIAATVALWWPDQASAPKSLGLYIQGGDAASYNNESIFPTCPVYADTPVWGVMQVLSQGPTYIQAGRDIHFEVRARDGVPPTSSTGGYCTFSITKLG